MNKTLRHRAELSLLYAVPLVSHAVGNTRLEGLQRKLAKEAQRSLQRMTPLGHTGEEKVRDLLNTWGKATGWLNTEKHVGTLLSFCALMIEESTYKYSDKLLGIINDIIEHLERGKDLFPVSTKAGIIAAAKWNKMFEEDNGKKTKTV